MLKSRDLSWYFCFHYWVANTQSSGQSNFTGKFLGLSLQTKHTRCDLRTIHKVISPSPPRAQRGIWDIKIAGGQGCGRFSAVSYYATCCPISCTEPVEGFYYFYLELKTRLSILNCQHCWIFRCALSNVFKSSIQQAHRSKIRIPDSMD